MHVTQEFWTGDAFVRLKIENLIATLFVVKTVSAYCKKDKAPLVSDRIEK